VQECRLGTALVAVFLRLIRPENRRNFLESLFPKVKVSDMLILKSIDSLPIAKTLENASYGTNMEKPSYRTPSFFKWGGLSGALKKEPEPSCEGPGMIRTVAPGSCA
jgi:hypothetical protein